MAHFPRRPDGGRLVSACTVLATAALTVLLSGPSTAFGASLSVFAGQPGGAGSRDAKGTLARFNFPSAICYDGKANLYVADTQNSTIRKVVVSSGAVSTFAGIAGFTGATDAKGTAARFIHPAGIACDGAGHLFVADTGNQTIREIKISTKAVTTLAGTPGQIGRSDGTGPYNTSFNAPSGLAYDPSGTLYIADNDNDTIRALDVATTTVSTLAGAAGTPGSADGALSAARFYHPNGLAFDGASKLFVADSENDTIRQIDLGAGLVSTLAGSAGLQGSLDGYRTSARFSWPMALSWDGSGLYIVDGANDELRRLDLGTSEVTTVAGAAGAPGTTDGVAHAARFSFPTGVAYDSKNGNVYVADRDNCAVRAVSGLSAAVTTIAGLALQPGNLDGLGTAAQFNGPAGLTYDAVAGITYVADMFNDTIRSIDVSGNVTTVAGAPGTPGSVDGTGPAATFNGPLGLAITSSYGLFVADVQNDTIRVVTPSTGTVVTFAGLAGAWGSNDGYRTSARFNQPSGIAFDGVASLYVTDTANDTIRKIDLNTWMVSTVAGSAGTAGVLDGSGSNARFWQPFGIAYDGTAFFYITDTGSGTIRKMDAAGNVTTVAGTAGVVGAHNGAGPKASFNQPQGVVYDGNGHLFVSDSGNALVRKIVLASRSVSTVLGVAGQAGVIAHTPGAPTSVGKGKAGLNDPVGLAFSPTAGLLIADEAENVVLVWH